MFTGEKMGDLMQVAARHDEQKKWFGATPPDLTIVARARGEAGAPKAGADWLYTYLRTFYRDASRATGWNNAVFPNVGMPHALWHLQGSRGATIEEVKADKDADGNVIAVHCEYMPDSKSGTPGSDTYKVKGNLHWVSVADAYEAEIRLYDRLFAHAAPGSRREGDPEGLERNFLDDLNPNSVKAITAQLEPALKNAKPEERFQFERHGYFVADRVDSKEGVPVFNRTVTLKDSWGKAAK